LGPVPLSVSPVPFAPGGPSRGARR
jgi:hypothetical protein